jgi:hypothetical protein
MALYPSEMLNMNIEVAFHFSLLLEELNILNRLSHLSMETL